MKKMNNKGFSLVELIIVIAIMAILAGAIAPALIRYIDKSRKSNDVSSCKTIKTAVETALGNESVYELLTTGDDYCYIYITPGEATGSTTTTGAQKCINFSGQSKADINGKKASEVEVIAKDEIGTNIGEKTPKLKYRKNAKDTDSKKTPTEFVAVVSKKGTIYVFISVSAAKGMKVKDDKTVGVIADGAENAGFQICPNVCDEYQ
ncbi:MAG: type II secretion system protein [Lachnospiraceae bacterium]|nr:type II secretion system protein [Lachnospiraceae bacterium]